MDTDTQVSQLEAALLQQASANIGRMDAGFMGYEASAEGTSCKRFSAEGAVTLDVV